MPRLTDEKTKIRDGKILKLIAEEKTVREIAGEVGCSYSTVYKVASENHIEIHKRQTQVRPFEEKKLRQTNFSKASFIMFAVIRELITLKEKMGMDISDTNQKLAKIKELIGNYVE